jgi:hypothetical protein
MDASQSSSVMCQGLSKELVICSKELKNQENRSAVDPRLSCLSTDWHSEARSQPCGGSDTRGSQDH